MSGNRAKAKSTNCFNLQFSFGERDQIVCKSLFTRKPFKPEPLCCQYCNKIRLILLQFLDFFSVQHNINILPFKASWEIIINSVGSFFKHETERYLKKWKNFTSIFLFKYFSRLEVILLNVHSHEKRMNALLFPNI